MVSDLKIGKPPRLNGENYKEWATALFFYLKDRQYWSIVDSTRKKPEKGKDDEDWGAENAMAAALIFSSVDKTQQQHILNSRNAKESWDTLKAIHKTPNE